MNQYLLMRLLVMKYGDNEMVEYYDNHTKHTFTAPTPPVFISQAFLWLNERWIHFEQLLQDMYPTWESVTNVVIAQHNPFTRRVGGI